MSAPASQSEWLFDAILHPNQSLSRRGFAIFMAVLGLFSFALGMFFLSRGAWPIFGFYGLEVLVIYVAIKVNRRRAALIYEKVRLNEAALLVERGNLRGQRETHSFQPFWVRVLVDPPHSRTGEVVITSHGRRVGVGAFLSRGERVDFARALTAALEFQRHPVGLFRSAPAE